MSHDIRGSTDQPVCARLPCPVNTPATRQFESYIGDAKLAGIRFSTRNQSIASPFRSLRRTNCLQCHVLREKVYNNSQRCLVCFATRALPHPTALLKQLWSLSLSICRSSSSLCVLRCYFLEGVDGTSCLNIIINLCDQSHRISPIGLPLSRFMPVVEEEYELSALVLEMQALTLICFFFLQCTSSDKGRLLGCKSCLQSSQCIEED
ncbi:hypothetical protein MJO28_010131 [Puccinia striiformis f. sp. tritici]|uniref:Uncharacterized protein n=1 Tax=Puccinia striiformis f. sp. tritici TaxID=168172 RepID=A0ACC0E504_9BASI|nr:hypothetical protein MJO28_010131 [Puccinia striiformis f. sp. tritici]